MQRKYILSNRIDFISRIDVIDLIFLKLDSQKDLLKEQFKNQLLNPHLDNSYDKDRNLWCVMNLL